MRLFSFSKEIFRKVVAILTADELKVEEMLFFFNGMVTSFDEVG